MKVNHCTTNIILCCLFARKYLIFAANISEHVEPDYESSGQLKEQIINMNMSNRKVLYDPKPSYAHKHNYTHKTCFKGYSQENTSEQAA